MKSDKGRIAVVVWELDPELCEWCIYDDEEPKTVTHEVRIITWIDGFGAESKFIACKSHAKALAARVPCKESDHAE